MKRKKYKDGDLQKHGFKDLQCVCGNYVRVNLDTTDVVCWQCVQKKVPVDKKLLMPLAKKDPSSGKPRGWRFMKQFVDVDGKVYERGIENPALKDTLPKTDVAGIKAQQKKKGKENKEKKALRNEKKEARLIKEFKKKKKFKEKEKQQKEEDIQNKFFGEE